MGRSTVSRELALHLARRGRRVLLVDAALTGGTQHIALKQAPRVAALDADIEQPGAELASFVLEGERDKPDLLVLSHARRGAAFPPRLKAAPFVDMLRQGPWDDIFIDTDARIDAFNATLFALADVPILVASTEATSLASCVELLRQTIVFALLLQPEADSVERRLLDALDALPADFDLNALHDAFAHPDVRPLLHHVVEHATPWLLFNHTRDAGERDLAQAIALGMSAMVGIRPRVLGVLGYDDRRWQQLREGNATHELAGTGDSLSLVAQRLLQLRKTADEQPRVALAQLRHPTELIGVPEELSPRDIRLAWRRLWDGLRRESPFTESVIPTPQREALVMQLEEANQRLQGWLRDRESVQVVVQQKARIHSDVARRLQDARSRTGISVRDLSLRSRIGLRYLEAIESFEIDALPREVYLRGYLREVARALGLDPDELVQDYLTELHQARVQRLQASDDETSS